MDKKYIYLILILVCSAFLRLYNLETNPPGLIPDEVLFGINSYNWKSDYTFIPRGVEFLSYTYYLIPTTTFLGLNEVSIRFPSALIGILTVFFLFLVTEKLFKYKIALVVSLLLSISFWHISINRNGFNWSLGCFDILLVLYLLLCGLKDKRYFIFSALIMGLSFYGRRTNRLLVPLLVIAFILVYNIKLKSIKKEIFIGGLILALLAYPLVLETIYYDTRFDRVTIIDMAEPLTTTKLFVYNYIHHFSPQFLFMQQDNPRFVSNKFGLLYLFQIPLLLMGLFYFFRARGKNHKLVLTLLFIAPIPSSLTQWNNHNLGRPLFMLLPILILCGYSLYKLWEYLIAKHKSIIISAMIVLFLIVSAVNIGLVIGDYFIDYPKYAVEYRNEGYKEIIQYAYEHIEEYDYIMVPKENWNHYILFYLNEHVENLSPEYKKFIYCKEESIYDCFEVPYKVLGYFSSVDNETKDIWYVVDDPPKIIKKKVKWVHYNE